MKTTTAILLATTPILHAGAPAQPSPEISEPPTQAWITPTIQIRGRYEFGNVRGLDASHALTFRERLGLKTAEWNGFSAFAEGEFTQAAVTDYDAGPPGVHPNVAGNTLIADPETNELNQAYLQYSGYDNLVRLGRQRIIYDNAAFIGNVGWRQNEQTYDAVSLANTMFEGLAFNYSYINQVNRIFGSEAAGPNTQYVKADTHLFNLSYTGIEGLTLGAYAYLMDFEKLATWDNNTFGISAEYQLDRFNLYAEVAWQEEAGGNSDREALYFHGFASTEPCDGHTLKIGVESLGAGFKTPLATVHAFNGFADVFIGGRIDGSHNGLTDCYISYTIPLFWGIKWSNVAHAFGDNSIDSGYGWEFDSVLSKKFDDNFLAIAKFAHFESEGDPFVGTGAGLPDTTRFSLELDYAF